MAKGDWAELVIEEYKTEMHGGQYVHAKNAVRFLRAERRRWQRAVRTLRNNDDIKVEPTNYIRGYGEALTDLLAMMKEPRTP